MTRRAASALTSAFVLGAVGRALGIIELIALGVAILAMVLVALASVWGRPRPRLGADRVLRPPSVHAGEVFDVELVIVNFGGRTPVLRCEELIDGGSPRKERRLILGVAPIERAGSEVAHYRLPSFERGRLAVGPMRVVLSDPVGFARRVVHVHPPADAVVFPAVSPCRIPLGLAHGSTGPPVRDPELVGLRVYAPGDDLRLVNWRASARTLEATGDLLMREGARDGSDRPLSVQLVTDPAVYGGTAAVDPAFEAAVEVVASLLMAAARAARPAEIRVGAASPIAAGSTWLAPALTVLATVQLQSPGPTAAGSAGLEDGERFVVTGRDDSRPWTGATLIRVDPSVTAPRQDGPAYVIGGARHLASIEPPRSGALR